MIMGKFIGKWASAKIGQHKMLWSNTRIFHSTRLQSEAGFLHSISTSQMRKLERVNGFQTENWD